MFKSSINFTIIILILFLPGCNEKEARYFSEEVPLSQSTDVQATENPMRDSPIVGVETPSVLSEENGMRTDIAEEIREESILSTCLPIRSVFSKELSGHLFALHFKTPFLLNLITRTVTEVKTTEIVFGNEYFVSPDGNWLAYGVYRDRSIVTVTNRAEHVINGSLQERIEFRESPWHKIEGWLSAEEIILTQKKQEDAFYSTLVVNPFTGEERAYSLEALPEYKSFKSGGVGLYHFPNGNVFPDPTLSRLIYPSWSDGQDYVTLWDLDSNKVIARIRDMYAYKNNPLWSPDDRSFWIPVSTTHTRENTVFDWFMVAPDGSIDQKTDFGELIENNEISRAGRSPNGRYIAFQMEYERDAEIRSTFIVLDAEAEYLEGFCIDARYSVSVNSKQPVWSPDNKYIVFSDTNESDDGALILVDIEKREAYEVAKDLSAKGWLVMP